MQKNHHITSLSILLVASIATLGVSWSFAAPKKLSGIFGTEHTLGSFLTTGNAGRAIIDTDPARSFAVETGATLKVTGEWIFLETVWWTKLSDSDTTLPTGTIGIDFVALPSATTITNYALQNNLYGWSDNAGWITFSALDSSYSGLTYVGGGLGRDGEWSFSGFAWSDNLWWIDFSISTLDFQNKVKVLWNIWGNKTFDVLYNVGSKFDSVSVTTLLNTIRKNIGLLTRSVPPDKINTDVATTNIKLLNKDTIIYRLPIGSPTLSNPNSILDDNDIRTLIIEWGDLYINNNVMPDTAVKTSRAIIVMKDANGNGGNIYINGTVRNIYATLVAEWSVYSWDDASTLENDTKEERETLPAAQLYINGSVISRNTIGWSQKEINGKTICPNFINLTDWCSVNESATYDWNYFRTYDKNRLAHGSDNDKFEEYSVIIEYDSQIIQDPPPWLTK